MSVRPEQSALFEALHPLPAGLYIEAAAAGVQASRLAREFTELGWRGVELTLADAGGDDIIGCLVADAGLAQACWMTVRGSAAVRALESWQAGAWRPLAVLVETGPLALSPGAAPAWREALARNGYLFAISADGYHYFVRSDQPALHAQLAEHASLAWRRRLQASEDALALAQREAAQARSALLMAKAKVAAENARAMMLQQRMDAIYASTSWQSTRLLRWSGRLRREPGPALRQLRAVGRSRLVALLGKLLARLTAKVNDIPGLRRHISALAARHPALARRVKYWLRPGAPLSNAMAAALPPAIDPSNMIGPQFKTLLLDELSRDQPPAPGQG